MSCTCTISIQLYYLQQMISIIIIISARAIDHRDFGEGDQGNNTRMADVMRM